VADLSWLVVGIGTVAGGVAGEVRVQRRVARRLGPRLAARWEALGGFERYHFCRELRRGRTVSEPALGAEVAAALRAELDRRWYLWLFGGLGALFLLLTAVTLAAGAYVLAAVEGVVAAALLGIATQQPRLRRKLAVAEEANRALAEAPPG
jgi:hypothetical protein